MRKILFILLCIFVSSLHAEDVKQGILNKLLAPGPLIQGHQELEKVDCLKCHDAGQGVPNAQCLACHKDLKASIDRKNTFHGLAVVKLQCINCHTDHKGRNFDSTIVEQKTFDHETTGHPLIGKHKEVKCADCHKETRAKMMIRKTDIRYFGPMQNCKSCHTKHDVHLYVGEYAAKDCNACHNEYKWKEVPLAKFDHFKATNFKLEGKHAEMTCAKCHTPNGDKVGPSVYKWQGLKSDMCLSCHKPYHKENLSPKFNNGQCIKCHTQDTWKIPKFNHGGVANMELKGKHATAQCVKCHVQTPVQADTTYKFLKGVDNVSPKKWTGLQAACITCHKDIHQSGGYISTRFGKMDKCQTCHNERGFKEGVNFNHNLDTSFKIDGKHRELTCIKCHINTDIKKVESVRVYKFKDIEKDNCVICHKSPHLKTFSKKMLEKRCNSCHVTTSWKDKKNDGTFNHSNDTRFPLDGKHLRIKCEECHKEGEAKIFKFNFSEQQFCVGCHANVHKEQFSEKFATKSCLECHNAETFKNLNKFDHSKTEFVLEGKHADPKTTCVDCHKPTKQFIVYKGANVRPMGNFFFENDKAGFCIDCHENVHKGQFSAKRVNQPCFECHTVSAFSDLKKFDHSKTNFIIEGKHADSKVTCVSCHKPSKQFIVYKGVNVRPKGIYDYEDDKKGYCEECHANVHLRQFTANNIDRACTSCHSTDTFYQRKSYDHALSKFPLVGFHEKAACIKCHTNTDEVFIKPPKNNRHRFIFKGAAENNCKVCHKDAHKGEFGNNCRDCHSESKKWKTVQNFHKDFMLSGVHYGLKCNECHRDQRQLTGMSESCFMCHQKDDKHHGTLPNCKECHKQEFWEVTTFKHSLTAFPLRGMHRILSCNACHAGGLYQGKPNDCISCHYKDKLKSVSVNHNIAGFESCSDCHGQFVFK
jgi:hypothetical protein